MTILRKKRCCCGKCREQKQSQQIKSYLEKTVDFNTECQYCTSETLEIAVEIEGVEDGSKEGVFVAEKSSTPCEWKYDLTDDGSELIVSIYSDNVLETYIMGRWVDKDKFPLFYWLFVEEKTQYNCFWDGAVASGDSGTCVIYSLEE